MNDQDRATERSRLVAARRELDAQIKAIDDHFAAQRIQRWAEQNARHQERMRRYRAQQELKVARLARDPNPIPFNEAHEARRDDDESAA